MAKLNKTARHIGRVRRVGRDGAALRIGAVAAPSVPMFAARFGSFCCCTTFGDRPVGFSFAQVPARTGSILVRSEFSANF